MPGLVSSIQLSVPFRGPSMWPFSSGRYRRGGKWELVFHEFLSCCSTGRISPKGNDRRGACRDNV